MSTCTRAKKTGTTDAGDPDAMGREGQEKWTKIHVKKLGPTTPTRFPGVRGRRASTQKKPKGVLRDKKAPRNKEGRGGVRQ